MYLKFLQILHCPDGIEKQAQCSALKKTRLNSWKDNFAKKSFNLSKKRKKSVLLNFLFPFVSLIGVFSTLKCTLWSSKPLHAQRSKAILLQWIFFTKVSNPHVHPTRIQFKTTKHSIVKRILVFKPQIQAYIYPLKIFHLFGIPS